MKPFGDFLKQGSEKINEAVETLNENAKIKALIQTFDANDKGSRGKFIAAAKEQGMKGTTASAYWQRNKKFAKGDTTSSTSVDGEVKKNGFLTAALKELKSSRQPGWAKGRIRNGVIVSDLGTISIQSFDGNMYTVRIATGRRVEEYQMMEPQEVPEKVQEMVDKITADRNMRDLADTSSSSLFNMVIRALDSHGDLSKSSGTDSKVVYTLDSHPETRVEADKQGLSVDVDLKRGDRMSGSFTVSSVMNINDVKDRISALIREDEKHRKSQIVRDLDAAKPTVVGSPLVQEANALLAEGSNSSGMKVVATGAVNKTSINKANGVVGRGGDNTRYLGVGVYARWPGSGLQLEVGVRAFEGGWAQITGKPAEQLTSSNVSKYIKAAKEMSKVQGIKPNHVADVVSKLNKEVKGPVPTATPDDLVDAITEDDIDGDIKDAFYAAADGLTSLDTVIRALERKNFGPEAAQLKKQIDDLRNNFIMKKLGAKL